MKSLRKQRGMTASGLMFGLVLAALVVLLGLKVFPMYMESFKIDTAMESLIADSKIVDRSKREIIFSLLKRLDIDDVRRINEQTYKEFVKVSKVKRKVSIQVKYRVEVPLFSNLSLVGDFDKLVEN